jgi:hypothetical protein
MRVFSILRNIFHIFSNNFHKDKCVEISLMLQLTVIFVDFVFDNFWHNACIMV